MSGKTRYYKLCSEVLESKNEALLDIVAFYVKHFCKNEKQDINIIEKNSSVSSKNRIIIAALWHRFSWEHSKSHWLSPDEHNVNEFDIYAKSKGWV